MSCAAAQGSVKRSARGWAVGGPPLRQQVQQSGPRGRSPQPAACRVWCASPVSAKSHRLRQY